MGFELQFLLPFNTKIVDKLKYETLSEFLTLPVQVSKGQTIARALEAGSPDTEVTEGVLFSIPGGQNVNQIISENISVSKDDKAAIVSKADGYLCARDEKLLVTKFCEVFGDVGPLTGDIRFPASIRIHGAVQTGYKVESDENIEALGLAEGAQLRAKGSVALKGGMAGVQKGKAIAGKDLHIKFAQQCQLEAGGSIIVNGPLMDCDLSAGGKVVLRGAATLVGGVTRSKMGITVPKIGSEGGAPTEVELGYNPHYARIEAERDEKIKISKKELTRGKKDAQFAALEFAEIMEYDADDALSGIMSMSDLVREDKVSTFDTDKKEKFNRLGAALLSIVHLREAILEMARDKNEGLREKGYANAFLRVEKIAHPGVKISMLGHTMALDKEYEMVKFVVRDGKIEPVYL